jgi:ketosteroid isomerase-like protein
MSGELVEAFERNYRAANEAFNRHDFEAAFRGFPSDFEWRTVAEIPGERTLRGPRQVIEGWQAFIEEFPNWRVEPQEFISGGPDTVVVRNLGTATSRSGVPVRRPFTQVWTFRDGRPIRVEEYWDHQEALEAVGLPQSGSSTGG